MTREELSLLLYLETCAVDRCGGTQSVRMNAEDEKILDRWNETGYVQSGRICAEDCESWRRGGNNGWARLSDQAWSDAHAERKARAERLWAERGWRTTQEARED